MRRVGVTVAEARGNERTFHGRFVEEGGGGRGIALRAKRGEGSQRKKLLRRSGSRRGGPGPADEVGDQDDDDEGRQTRPDDDRDQVVAAPRWGLSAFIRLVRRTNGHRDD